MRFLHGSFNARIGDIITVGVTKPTRILIMKERDFMRYKNGITFTYHGGHKESEYEFTVPASGVWCVVIEKGTGDKPLKVEATVKKERPAKTLAHHAEDGDNPHETEATDGDSSEE